VLIRELDLSKDIEFKVVLWITYRKLIKNQLVKFRSNCVEEMKKEYFKGTSIYNVVNCFSFLLSHYFFLYTVKDIIATADKDEDFAKQNAAYLQGARELLCIVSAAGMTDDCTVISLRDHPDKKHAFFFCAREFVPCVVKRLYFRQNKYESLFSDYVTVSDEAFTLLLLENNTVRWDAMYSAGTTKSTDKMPPQKFLSTDDNGDDKGALVRDGYGVQAAVRYNEYYNSVETNRRQINTEDLEEELRDRMKEMDGKKTKGDYKKKRKRNGELNLVDDSGSYIAVRYEL